MLRAVFAAVLLSALLDAHDAPATLTLAKSGNTMQAVTIGGGTPSSSIEVELALPDHYDEMHELSVPRFDSLTDADELACKGSPHCLAARAPPPRLPAEGEVPYRIVLHYDFAEHGGSRDWSGWWDGNDVLYFPEHMIVGPGLWAAGWYRANPLFRSALRDALPATVRPPATGDAGLIP